MNAKQEEALRDWLQEAIVPLIEQVLVKKLGQAMTYASKELIQPKREWQGLTDEDLVYCESEEDVRFVRAIEAKLKEKNT